MDRAPSTSAGLNRFYKTSLGVLAMLLIGWMCVKIASMLIDIVVVLGIATLLAYMLLAPVNVLEHGFSKLFNWIAARFKLSSLHNDGPSKLTRIIAVLLMYVSLIILILVSSVRFVPKVSEQLFQFSHAFPRYIAQAEEWVLAQPFAQTYFHQEVEQLRKQGHVPQPVQDRINQEIRNENLPPNKLSPTEKVVVRDKVFALSDHMREFFKRHAGNSALDLYHVVVNTISGFVYTLTTLVLVFYFLVDGPALKQGVLDMMPRRSRHTAQYLFTNIHKTIFTFVKGQVLLGIATGIYMTILYLIFGVPYALFLGSFFAVSEIIPVVGTWIGFAPGILVLLFVNPIKLIFVVGLMYIFQTLKDNLVAPRVIGRGVGLHPVVVMMALLISARLAGFVGVLFAIPITSVIKVIIQYFQHQDNQAVLPDKP